MAGSLCIDIDLYASAFAVRRTKVACSAGHQSVAIVLDLPKINARFAWFARRRGGDPPLPSHGLSRSGPAGGWPHFEAPNSFWGNDLFDSNQTVAPVCDLSGQWTGNQYPLRRSTVTLSWPSSTETVLIACFPVSPYSVRVGQSGDQEADWCATDALEGVDRQSPKGWLFVGGDSSTMPTWPLQPEGNCRACDTVPAVPEKTNRVVVSGIKVRLRCCRCEWRCLSPRTS